MDTVTKLFHYYLAKQDDFVREYNGKYIVLHDNAVAGSFTDFNEAYDFGVDKYGLGNMIVQLCTPGTDAYTLKFNTFRVAC